MAAATSHRAGPSPPSASGAPRATHSLLPPRHSMTPPSDGLSPSRYSLRFESGERAGETVAITHSGMVLGRRPGTSLQIVEPSVSGRHAELDVDDGGVTLRDLGSTNGTRVGKEKIQERRLAHGDVVSIGSVRLTFLDAAVAGVGVEIDLGDDDAPPIVAPPPAVEAPPVVEAARPASSTPSPAVAGAGAELDASGAGEGLRQVSADRVARSGRRSILPLLLVVLLLLGGGAAWFLLRGGPGGAGRDVVAVEAVDGNLLADGYSFEDGGEDGEDEAGGWETDEDAVAAFALSAGASRSGEQGLVADLAAGEWSLAASPAVRAPTEGALELVGHLRVEGDARARLGVRFSASADGGPTPVQALSAPLEETDGFVEVALRTPVPPGYDRARAIVLAVAGASGEGASVDVDDVALVPGGQGRAAASFEENRVHLLGEPAYTASLFEIDTVVLSGISAIDSEAPQLGGVAPLTATSDPRGVALELGSSGSPDRLVLRAEPAALTGGVATIGAGGYRTHAAQFEREDVDSLLVGAGRDLVRLALRRPTRVVGRPAGDGFRLELELRPGEGLLVQLGFREERATAAGLAARARTAEREGRPGDCVALWSELLDGFPYERSLVEEAEEARSRLVQAGMQELQGLAGELERAGFFGLADLYREVRGRVQDVVERYAGSDVALAGSGLVAAIDAQLAGLEDDREGLERERLGAILSALRESEMTALAGAVEQELARAEGDADPDPATEAR